MYKRQLHTNVFVDVTCIQVKPDSLLTDRKTLHFDEKIENFQSDLDKDVLKIVYLNRYFNSKPQVGFISGIGLKRGAFASSISHDSHNIIAVGCTCLVYTSGITITTSRNADVRAVFKGVVTEIMFIPGDNNVVIVRHGNYLTVYSNLLEIFIKKGDTVNVKQKIGKLAVSSGCLLYSSRCG